MNTSRRIQLQYIRPLTLFLICFTFILFSINFLRGGWGERRKGINIHSRTCAEINVTLSKKGYSRVGVARLRLVGCSGFNGPSRQ